ncbi:MAG TPA: PEP-CTERM sorting domain-containing protein [Fimbriimonadaceae bacterium]|nr:PEP-CTERM sorting domain-containing protein [Fimbriimonadaceae bacterium]
MIATGSGHAVMIDDFLPVDHANDLTFGDRTYVNRSFVHSYGGSVLGGERDVELVQRERTFINPPQFFARWQHHDLFNGDFFRVGVSGPGAGNGTANGRVFLQYDGSGDEVGNTGLDKHLNNIGAGQPIFPNLGGFRMLVNDYRSTAALTVEAVLRSSGNELGRVSRLLGSRDDEWRQFLFPFSSEQLSIADSLTFEFDTQSGGDGVQAMYIKQIDTIVPEPSSVLGLIGGCSIWMVCKRRAMRTGP